MTEMKRVKITDTVNCLFVPNNDKYYCLKYISEERVLDSILDLFKEAM